MCPSKKKRPKSEKIKIVFGKSCIFHMKEIYQLPWENMIFTKEVIFMRRKTDGKSIY